MSDDTRAVEGVPYLSLQGEFEALRAEWFGEIEQIGGRGAYILGPNVSAFEEEAAAYLGAGYGVAVANGTDALVLALRALGIGPRDQVITTPFTFFATAEAISTVGATPVFVDIRADDFNLDPARVEERITDRTRAVLPVHIFGHPADMGPLAEIAEENDLRLIEDGAQAFGAKYADQCVGSIGDAGCFSFYPTKVLGCYGDGGLVTVSSEEARERLLVLRNHGATAPFMHDRLGYNSRLDEIQAALLRIKLRKVEADIAARNRVAEWYEERLQGREIVLPGRPSKGRHGFNLYTIRHPERDRLRAHLNANRIGNSQCYPLGLHLQEVYRHLGYARGDLPVVDKVCGETLSLPIYPGMTEAQVDRVAELVAEVS